MRDEYNPNFEIPEKAGHTRDRPAYFAASCAHPIALLGSASIHQLSGGFAFY